VIDTILKMFIYINTAAAYLCTAVLIAFIAKHRKHQMNGMLTVFAISSALIAVMYTLISLGICTSEELIPFYRIVWTSVLIAPAAFTIALWNDHK